MKSDSRRLLLDDVLQEEDSFHERVLDEMLRQARRRRHARRAVRGGVALLVAGLVATLLLNQKSDPRSPSAANDAAAATVLTVVETHVGSVAMVSSSPGDVTLVETAAHLVEPVSDERLLALVAPRPAALVWRTPSEAELIFADYQVESERE